MSLTAVTYPLIRHFLEIMYNERDLSDHSGHTDGYFQTLCTLGCVCSHF